MYIPAHTQISPPYKSSHIHPKLCITGKSVLFSNKPKIDLFFYRSDGSCFSEDHKPFAAKANKKHKASRLIYWLTLTTLEEVYISVNATKCPQS